MKTTFIYGLGMAIAGAVLNFAFYFAGMHDSAETLGSAQRYGMIIGLLITLVGLVMAIRARRSETPLDEDFGYGRALWAGTLTSFWGALFGNVFNILYVTAINPGITDVAHDMQVAAWEEAGMTADQIAGAEKMMEMFTNPAIQFVMGLIMAFIFSFIFSLIIAIFVRRSAEESFEAPPLES